MKEITTIILALVATITGHLTWVLVLVNLLWLLVKDAILFSWTYPIISASVFLLSAIVILINIVRLK